MHYPTLTDHLERVTIALERIANAIEGVDKSLLVTFEELRQMNVDETGDLPAPSLRGGTEEPTPSPFLREGEE